MKLMFFDVECANMFDGLCKMCSFGYVITNENFEVIEKRDIIINPESEFDRYFFKKNSKITLAYSKDNYLSNPNFPYYFQEIDSVLSDEYLAIFGYHVREDLKYIYQSCERYNFPKTEIEAYDVRKIAIQYNEYSGKLMNIPKDVYVFGNQSVKPHKSDDDALITMTILKAVCNKNNLAIRDLIQRKEFEKEKHTVKKNK